MKFYIFRHAATFPSKGMIPYEKDNFKTDILYEGKESTEKIAEYLKDIDSDLNISSPYNRCKETVEIISQISGKKFIFDERLGEFLDISLDELIKRLMDFLNEVASNNYQNVIICTHGATMTALIHLIMEKDPNELIVLSEYLKTGVVVIIEEKNMKEIDFN